MLCPDEVKDNGTGPLSIRVENPLDHSQWDARAAALDRFSFFHSAAWAEVLRDTYGFQPVYFTAAIRNGLAAALPVMEVNSILTGRRGVSLPFTDYCEPIGASLAALGAVREQAVEHGRARGWKYLECRGGREMFPDAGPSVAYFGHRLNLFADFDFLFSKLESSVRRAIRKAEKSGVTVEVSRSLEATQEYFGLHCRTRKRHGLPPQPFRFFRNIYERILARNLGIVVSARHNGRLIAAAIFFHTPAEAIYKFGASAREFQELRANNLVMWEAIQWYARRGTRCLCFGRSSVANEGLRRYKRGWGTEEHPLEYFRYDLRRNRFVAEQDDTGGWHSRVFRALPIFAARWMGAVLYRHAA